MQKASRLFTLFILILVLAACAPATPETTFTITLVVDGMSQVLLTSGEVTVNDVLREASITLGDLDRVNPPGYNRVQDGMTITVVRVRDETVIETEIVPFQSRTTTNEGLPVGSTQLIQAGVNGVAEVTYRIVYENGVEISRTPIRRIVITEPQDEVIMVGADIPLEPVTVEGTLIYISGGNAWIIRQNSEQRRPLTLEGGLDGRIFALSGDGQALLFSRQINLQDQSTPPAPEATADPARPTLALTDIPTPTAEGAEDWEGSFNRLYAILDTTDPNTEPVALELGNVLWADWVPGTTEWIAYSTAEPRPGFPGWQANNDLWRARVMPDGRLRDVRQILDSTGGGVYGWYGTVFSFSPDGATLAWASPGAVGVLIPIFPPVSGDNTPTPSPTPDPDIPPLPLASTYVRQTLASFAPRNAFDYIWIPSLAWSSDGTLLATTTHGPPLGGENAEDSPIFNLTVIPPYGGYSIDLIERAGMWSLMQFSPVVDTEESLELPLAYLESIDPLESINGRYRLVLIDRDGSNRRILYPTGDQLPIRPRAFTWSPDGRQIAFIVEGNLFLIDITTGLTRQITGDGASSEPRWSQ